MDEIQRWLVYWSCAMMHLSNEKVLNQFSFDWQVRWYVYNMVMNWILLVSLPVKVGTSFAIRVIRYMHLISFIQNCQFWPFSNKGRNDKNRYLAVATTFKKNWKSKIFYQFIAVWIFLSYYYNWKTSLNRNIWIFIY